MERSSVLVVRVTPRSGRDEIADWEGDVLRVRLRAPPVEGRANEALCRFVAEHLGVPASSVSIAAGGGSRTKRLRIEGLTSDEVRSRLG